MSVQHVTAALQHCIVILQNCVHFPCQSTCSSQHCALTVLCWPCETVTQSLHICIVNIASAHCSFMLTLHKYTFRSGILQSQHHCSHATLAHSLRSHCTDSPFFACSTFWLHRPHPCHRHLSDCHHLWLHSSHDQCGHFIFPPLGRFQLCNDGSGPEKPSVLPFHAAPGDLPQQPRPQAPGGGHPCYIPPHQ